MFLASWRNWWKGTLQLLTGRCPRRHFRRIRLHLESLEDRSTPAQLDISGNLLTYTADTGESNVLRVSVTGSGAGTTYTFNDTGALITLGAGATGAGWTGSGTNTVTGTFAAGAPNTIRIDLGDQNDTANIQSINNDTTILGGAGDDLINVSSNAPGNTGNLAGINGTLTVTADSGSDRMVVSNFSASSGGSNVVIDSNQITGFAPSTVAYNSTGGSFSLIRLIGSNSPSLAEVFTIDHPGAPVQLDANSGPDTANIRNLSFTATVRMGAGNDIINVSSDAPANLGNLDGINATLTVDAGGGSNVLAVSDFGSLLANPDVLVNNLQIQNFSGSANDQTITYQAIGGTFSAVTLNGSDTQSDTFKVAGNISTLNLMGNGGGDTFEFTTNGSAVASIAGGADSDSLIYDPAYTNPVSVTLASSDATGFTSTPGGATGVNGTFSGIDSVTGTGSSSLTGENSASTWTPGSPSTYQDGGGNTLTFTGFTTLNGGTASDTLVGVVDVTLTGSTAATGFAGNFGSTAFNGMNQINGSGFLTGADVDSTWTINGSGSYSDGTNTLGLSGFTTFNGGSANDTFDVSPSLTDTLTINGGDPTVAPGDVLNLDAQGQTITQVPGSITAAGFFPVDFTSIETLNVTNTTAPPAPQDLTLDPSTDSGPAGDNLTNFSQVRINGTAALGSTVRLFDGTTEVGSATASGPGGAWSILTTALADGAHNLTATATDAANNTGPASTVLTVTVDTRAPVPPVLQLSPPSDNGISNTDSITTLSSLTFTGFAEPGSTVGVFVDGVLLGTVTADGNSAWSFTTPPLADGPHRIAATATDAAGNTSTFSAPLVVTVDSSGRIANPLTTVNGRVRIKRTRPRRVRGRRRRGPRGPYFRQGVTITNLSSAALDGPLFLVLDRLPTGIQVLGASGRTRGMGRKGQPFIRLDVGSVAVGDSLQFGLVFRNPQRRPITWQPRLLAGVGAV